MEKATKGLSIADGPYPDRYSTLDVKSQNTESFEAMQRNKRESAKERRRPRSWWRNM